MESQGPVGQLHAYFYIRRREGAERIFEEAMPEQFPNLIENINLHIQEAQQPPSKTNAKRYTQATHTRHTQDTQQPNYQKAKDKGYFESIKRKVTLDS